MARKTLEPFLWTLFSAGGVVAALLIPIHILLFGLAFPLGWLGEPSYDRLVGLVRNPLVRVYLLVLCTLPLFHAAHRFFQMDLLRRQSAGELAELFGERALEIDRAQRPFGYREHARKLLATLPAEQAAWLDAYTEGVNAGLDDMRARPPEYWLVGGPPRE